MISNFRRHALSLSLLIGVAAVPAAFAQASISSVGSGSVEDRVTTLERISNAQSQLMQQLQQQLNDTQSDIDSLRGQIQENSYQLSQVVERQNQLYQQIDTLSSNNTTQTTPANSDSKDATAASGSAPAAAASPAAQSGDENSDYNAGIDLILKQKKFDQAISALQTWVKKYPDSTYQPNANYWLGQLYYNKGQLDDSAYYFATVVKNYPKSPKAPEALFKVGVVMQDKKDTAKSKAVFEQVIKLYPGTASARDAKKRLEAGQ
ncbi:exported TPR repeat-containing prenylyltransferase domain protein [Tatumella ptyseos ATCC 33301]|uniref:Cell division coordinator CpoB n=2 Tax=Tatumella ptyseos TaxID=82987 RepID=A0A085JBT6_9GAMM|nr:cell division protein CpoB [Tatumella ptyseos]KFD17932.1 exported TPR repeat-containing prenylyltransferase domain protein [Tatumella ptyseos ATCC 33301]SQK74015.1 tol-pal system protein YbgF [Tatumella ptyseos]